jgi:hypothetical protein
MAGPLWPRKPLCPPDRRISHDDRGQRLLRSATNLSERDRPDRRLGVRESGMNGVGLGVQMVQFWAVMVANRAG